MALPTKSKTWVYSVNNVVTQIETSVNNCKKVLLAIKNALKVGSGWSVKKCSYYTGSAYALGADNVDEWSSITNLGGATPGTDHAWIVLKNTVLNMEICIDESSSTHNILTIVVAFDSSGSGFSGGTTANRPTASSKSVTIINNAAAFPENTSATTPCIVSYMISDGYDCTRLVTCFGGYCNTFILIDRADSKVTAWDNGNIVFWKYSGSPSSNVTTYANMTSAANFKGINSTTELSIYATTTMYGAAMLGQNFYYYTELGDPEFIITPCGLYSSTTGNRGRIGRISDFWLGPTNNMNVGDTYPDDATYSLAQFKDVILPWSGVLPRVL